jgi:hypothetical protein
MTDALPAEAERTFFSIMDLIAEGRFDDLIACARATRVSADALGWEVEAYGKVVLPLDRDARATAEVLPLNDRTGWAVDLFFRTEEEGQSDLALRLRLLDAPMSGNPGLLAFEIEDILVP